MIIKKRVNHNTLVQLVNFLCSEHVVLNREDSGGDLIHGQTGGLSSTVQVVRFKGNIQPVNDVSVWSFWVTLEIDDYYGTQYGKGRIDLPARFLNKLMEVLGNPLEPQ